MSVPAANTWGTAAKQPAQPGALLLPAGEHFRVEGSSSGARPSPIPFGARLSSWDGGGTLVPEAGSCLQPADGEIQHTSTVPAVQGKSHTKDTPPTPNGTLASTITTRALIQLSAPSIRGMPR